MPDRDSCADAAAALVRIAERSANREQRAWLALALAAARNGGDVSELVTVWGGVARRLRSAPASATAADLAVLERSGLRGVEGWPLDRVVRTILVCEAARVFADVAAVVDTLYRTADNDERVALLGALPALPGGERFVGTAVAACRTNVTSVFEAIACGNPYPARYFSDEAFNQMVIKALFLGVAASRIENLHARVNSELSRMVAAYASERRAAGRSVPDDVIDLISSLEAAAS